MLCRFLKTNVGFGLGEDVHKIKSLHIKKVIFIALSITTIFLMSRVCLAYSGVPEQVRIGLYFNDDKTNQYTALSSFTIDSESGLQFGSYEDSTFTVLTEEDANSTVTIRKDAFYVNNSGKLTEYNRESGKIPEGEKLGAFHANLGGSYESYEDLSAYIEEYRKNGIDAFPVFSDTWQIWAGFYVDENALKAALGDSVKYTVIPPSPTRIVVSSSKGEVKLLYDSSVGVFRVYPKKGNDPAVFRINCDNKKVYRGALEILRQKTSDMTLINVLPTEEYLYGVVPEEIGASSPVEALKAQAVAARTYTLNTLSKYSHLKFNLCTTTYTQVYKGYSAEKSTTNKAVDDTKGEIVTYNNKPAAVFYFSSSGGKTEDVKNVWGSEGYPYLVSVDDPYESGKSWHYNWQVSYTAQKISEIMTSRGFKLGKILAVYITKRSEAGRATELVVKGSNDQRIYTNGNTRSFLSLDSQWFDITTDSDVPVLAEDGSFLNTQLSGKKVMTSSGLKTINVSSISTISSDNVKNIVPSVPTTYTFTGKGWGHGIGMSQEGAKGMADAGFTYDEILTHYFPGTKVE